MTSMIERVAEALYTKERERHVTLTPLWGNLSEPQNIYWREAARVAIAAMREPTEGMWLAPVMTEPPIQVHGINPSGEEITLIWEAMIDEALKE